jgi:hypothetical protein
MTQDAKKPRRSGDQCGFRKQSIQRISIRKPPYSNRLNLNGQNLVICTGSGAWDRAKSPTWFPGCKIVLPFGSDPASYTWSIAAGRDVLIAGFGELELIGTIAKLAGLLLAVGADFVIYAPEHAPIIRIDVRRAAA